MKKAVLNCSTIDGFISRLDCYDALAKRVAESGQPSAPGEWTAKVGKGLGGQIVGASDPVVWTRFGGTKAEKKRWSVSTDEKAVFLPGDAKPFIQRLLAVDRLTVQLDHFLCGPVTDVFDVPASEGRYRTAWRRVQP